MTNDPPAIPTKKRSVESPEEELTRPVSAVGMLAIVSTHRNRIRAPNLSQRGPNKNLTKIVDVTLIMLDVQICWSVRWSVDWMTGSSGEMANQVKKAAKNPIQEQWNALICGLAKLSSLISDALSSWKGSTLTWYLL